MRNTLKILRMTSVTILVALIHGCATYEPLKSKDQQEEKCNEVILTQDSITVHFFPYIDPALCAKHLGIKPNKAQMIPSLLKIENNGSRILKVNLDKCTLAIANEPCSPLTLEDALDRARRSGAEVVAWQLGFGLIGMSMAANNVTSTNRSLEEDYHSKYFKPTLISSGKTAEGVIFNQFPKKMDFHHCIFSLNMIDMNSQEPVNITIEIPDSILTDGRPK